MRKGILTFAIAGAVLFTLQSCVTNKVVLNREVETKEGDKMLLGDQSLDQFQKEPYRTWYDFSYSNYTSDAEVIKQLRKEKINSYEIVLFLGTWCSDSHNNFPKMIRVLEDAGYNTKKIKIVGVNKKKESPTGDESYYNVQKVPTLIVRKYGKEVGRIIENPKTGLIEKDLVEILQSKKVSAIQELFKKTH